MDIIFKEYGRVLWLKNGYFLLALVALAAAVSLDIAAPIFYKHIANGLAAPYTPETLADIMHNLQGVALTYAGIWCSWRIMEIAIVPLNAGGVNLLEKRCFAVLTQQKMAFFESQFSGSLIKQAGRFSRSFESVMDWFFFQFYMNLIALGMAFSIFFQAQPTFAWIFLAWVVVFITWNIVFSSWKIRFDKAVAEGDSLLGGVVSDAISNMFIVKSFALEQNEQGRVNAAADWVYRKKAIAWFMQFASFAVQGLLTFGIELYLVYLMIQAWQVGQFNVGEFVLFQSIMMLLIQRLWEFGRNFRNLFVALADATEMADIIRRQELEVDAPGAQAHSIQQGAIRLEDLCFSYYPQDPLHPPLFEHFNLVIQPGEKIALVGHSGSGKSTLTKLLFRFLEPQAGQICFDGLRAHRFTLQALRQQISMVPQQPELFHRSIRDNIALGATVSEARLLEVATQAQCLAFITELPQQFDTLVGERGVKLSGGERQRIAIARAFLEDAPIVVLDEATSALDSLTEQEIQRAIFALIKQKTAIVIAHRLSTILTMDRIVVLEQGRIIEQGTHQELLAIQGKYYAMWQHQRGDFLGE